MNIVTKTCLILLQIAALSLAVSCSDTDQPNDKNSIQKATDKIAHEAVDMINKPIDEAKQVEKLGNDHALKLEEAAKLE